MDNTALDETCSILRLLTFRALTIVIKLILVKIGIGQRSVGLNLLARLESILLLVLDMLGAAILVGSLGLPVRYDTAIGLLGCRRRTVVRVVIQFLA